MSARPDACLVCHRQMRPRGASITSAPGTVMHNGRGLCKTCYCHPGVRDDYERATRPGDELIDDVHLLLTRGDIYRAANALGITTSAIAQAAKRHGDQRLARLAWSAAKRERSARR